MRAGARVASFVAARAGRLGLSGGVNRLVVSVLLVISVAACSAPARDAASDTRSPAADTAPPLLHGVPQLPWPNAIGTFLAVENARRGEALLFRADTTALPLRIGVVGFDSVGSAVALRDVRPLPCATRALLRVIDAPSGWSLALDSVHARPVPIDALEDLTPADSQRMVVRIQRAANALPDSAAAMEYRGLPVVVRDAWIVRLSTGPVIVARVARLRNLEATAHEELRFLVLENDQPRYVARVAGDEEVVESWDLLAALMTDRGPVLAVAREGTRTLQLELVGQDNGAWRSLWRSDGLICGPR